MIFPVCFTISWSISPSWLNSNFVASVPNVLRFQTLVLLVILRWCFPRKFQWRMDSRGFSLPGWVIHEVITFKDIHGEARQLRRELIRKTRDQPTWSIFLGDCLHICVCVCWALLNLHPCQKSWHAQYPLFLLLEIMCSTIIFPACKPQVLSGQPVIQGSYPFPSIESYRWCVIYIYIHMCVQPRVSTISIPICIFLMLILYIL